jgi:serine/threonine protein kinase
MLGLAGVTVGSYFLLECLGQEGMVETYRARPITRGGFDVVLRLFRPPFPDPSAFHEHFISEVEKVWRCHHEHIQPLVEYGAGDDLLFDVTQFTDYKTLEQVIEREESEEIFMPIPQIVSIITQLCATLHYVHERHIVHGNIQPSSILIQPDQEILLTNFSLKHIYQEGDPLGAHIEEGNPAYIAPEQVIGMLTPASDIYAIAVLLFRLLTGYLPYDGVSSGEIALKHENEAIPSLRLLRPDLSESVELVVRVALAKIPEARFSSANALARALLAAITLDSTPIVSVKPQRRLAVHTRRKTPLTWSRALSMLAIFLILFALVSTLNFFANLPLHIQNISGPPFHADTHGSIVGVQLSKSTPTTTSGGSIPSTTSPNDNSSTPPVRMTPTGPALHVIPTSAPIHVTPTISPVPSQTPLVNATYSPYIPLTHTIVCVSGNLTVGSSQNLQPLLQQIGKDYTNSCPELAITLHSGGSRSSLHQLEQGGIDIAGSDLAVDADQQVTDHPIGALLYALIVSPDVEVNGLSSVEIQEIFQGQVSNWAQVGGSNKAIKVMLPPAGASINAIFQTFVLNNVADHVNAQRMKRDAPMQMAQSVFQTSGAISFVPLALAQEAGVKILTIDGVSPTEQTLINGTYTFWSIEHLYTQNEESAPCQEYLLFLSSDKEQHVLSEFGIVPMNMLNQSTLESHFPGPEL